MQKKITVLIMAQNSQKTLRRTLESVRRFDEIIIVDGGSTDNTAEICKEFRCRYILHPFTSFSAQRNFMIKEAQHSWCLFVDSDEAVTDELREALYAEIEKDQTCPLYRIMRTEYIQGVEITVGHGSSGYQERFFLKDRTEYVGEVHEFPVIDGVKPGTHSPLIGYISDKCRLLHNPDNSVSDIIRKLVPYSILKAQENIAERKTTNALFILITFVGTFFKVYRRSYGAGKRGFISAILEANHRMLTKLLIYEKQMLDEEALK